jgi:hypothetical protein
MTGRRIQAGVTRVRHQTEAELLKTFSTQEQRLLRDLLIRLAASQHGDCLHASGNRQAMAPRRPKGTGVTPPSAIAARSRSSAPAPGSGDLLDERAHPLPEQLRAALGGGEAIDRGLILLQHPECPAALGHNRDAMAQDLPPGWRGARLCSRPGISASIWPT